MAMPTLLDIAKRSGVDSVVALIDEATRQTPELSGRVTFRGEERIVPNVGAARTIKGQTYKTLIRTALPTVGFRNANEGVAASKSQYENRLVQTYILNGRFEVDKAVADGSEDGWEPYLADEAMAITKASMQTLAKQFYYGTAADAKGHPGLVSSVDATMAISAGGTTAGTASSVWGVKFGPDAVQWVWGQDGQLEPSEVRIESITDENGNRFTAYVQEMLAYPGVQVRHRYAIGRIYGLTEDTGKGLTDARLGALLAKYPVGHGPDAFFLSRRSLEQLRSSRTATNATGAEAPTPTEYEGVPLIPTDSILDTEAITG